ncbi:MAG: hypothetical protein IPI83_04915 [Sphingomonadales bacterium]|nr:hypothetical protein [Sphingomonadales bacterium]
MRSTKLDPLDQMVSDYSLVTKGYAGRAPNNPYPMLAEKRSKCPVMHGDILLENMVPSMADYMMTGRPTMSLLGRVRQGGVISAVAVGHRQAALAVMCKG